MTTAYDPALGATLLETLPPKKDGTAQYRELISGDLKTCLDHAATMTEEGRARLHIETADGGRIEAAELAGHFHDPAVAPAPLPPPALEG